MQVGDKVLISPNSGYYGFGIETNNPKNTVGRLTRITNYSSELNYEVIWENPDKDSNFYDRKDLILTNNLALLLFSIDLKS